MEENKTNNFKYGIHNFTEYTSGEPIYREKTTRGGWVSYGEDNLYPEYLLSLQNRSAKHNAILQRKALMLGGNGWNKELIKDEQAAIRFFNNMYNDDNLDVILYKSAYDLEIFGAFALEVIYSKDGTKISEVNYLPANKVRLSDDEKFVFYSDDWSNTKKFPPIKKPKFNPQNPTQAQILYVREYRPGVEYYGIPDYISVVNWVELEYEISLYHLNQVKNGFHPSMILNFSNGVPSDDEIEETVRQMQNDFQGAMKAGKVMFLFSDGKDRAVEVTPVQLNNSDERFIELNKEITQGILTGHNVVNPNAFGISVAGSLGGKNEILESIELFQATYIDPKMRLIEGVFNRLASFNEIQSQFVINPYKIDFTNIEGDEETEEDVEQDN